MQIGIEFASEFICWFIRKSVEDGEGGESRIMPAIITGKQRKQLLQNQHEACALCKKSFSILDQICYDSVQGKLVDRRCMMLLSVFRTAQNAGVSFEKLVAYEGRE